MDNDTLRLRARQAIESGELPRERPEKLWGSSGDDSICPVCKSRVSSQQAGYELQDRLLHLPCFQAWEDARRELDPL